MTGRTAYEYRACDVAYGALLMLPENEPGCSEWRVVERTFRDRGVTVVFERAVIGGPRMAGAVEALPPVEKLAADVFAGLYYHVEKSLLPDGFLLIQVTLSGKGSVAIDGRHVPELLASGGLRADFEALRDKP